MSPRILFRTFAFAEVVTWVGLITAMILRGTGVADIVPIAGGVHGFVFLAYCAITILIWIDRPWRPLAGVLGLAASVVPFATIPFENVAQRRGLLAPAWRLGRAGDAAPRGFFEHVVAWILRHLALAVVLIAVVVIVVFVVLLRLGPPVG